MGCVNLGCKGVSIMLGSRISRTYDGPWQDVELHGRLTRRKRGGQQVGREQRDGQHMVYR